MNAVITCSELKERIGNGAVVVDVMTPEDYAACHVAGAHNACIYEMVFLDRVAGFVPDRKTGLIVYDATGSSSAAESARERLQNAGYGEVAVLAGGLRAWRDAGLPVETGEGSDRGEPVLRDGNYRIDIENSRVEWIGRNLSNRHHGRIAVQSGELLIVEKKPSAGRMVLDMASLANTDLQEPDWQAMLIRHLKSEDFFAVERYPTASFVLTGWEPREAFAEAPGGIATGELTIKDVARRVDFRAIVAPQPDGSLKAHAVLDIDRTLWNVRYGSCKMFERLGMHLVNDFVSLEVFVLARMS